MKKLCCPKSYVIQRFQCTCTSKFIIICHTYSILHFSRKKNTLKARLRLCRFVMSANAFSSRAFSLRSKSFALAAPGMFTQLTHWHPSEQSMFFFLQPHLMVVQPVTHLHPFSSTLTLSRIACTFSGISQTTVSLLSLSVQHCSLLG